MEREDRRSSATKGKGEGSATIPVLALFGQNEFETSMKRLREDDDNVCQALSSLGRVLQRARIQDLEFHVALKEKAVL